MSRPPSRVLRLHGPREVRLERVDPAAPAVGEVLLELEVALTGGTVLKTVNRGGHPRLGDPPLALGHEGVGRVLAVGPGVTSPRVGERVLPAPSAPCGTCRPCLRGREPLCTEMRWFSGLFADRVVLPRRHVAANLHSVPAGLAPERAALADNVACVLHGLEATPARSGDRALVIGTGPLGLLWTRFLADAGAEVTLVGRRAEAAAAGSRFGAARACAWDDLRPLPEHDLVVEAVGSAETWQRALLLAAPGGSVNLFGGAPRRTLLEVDATRLHYDELVVAASFHYAPRHVTAALHWLAGAAQQPARSALLDTLLGDRLPLTDLPAWLLGHLSGPTPRKAAVVP
jgi:L-iditol 2-dehydrogenase